VSRILRSVFIESDFESPRRPGPHSSSKFIRPHIRECKNTLVNNRIAGVKQATAIKIRKAEEIIERRLREVRREEDSIIRLHRGRIRNLRNSEEQKIREIESKRPVSVSFSTIAGGIVRIEE